MKICKITYKLFYFYLFLFIFTAINKEFLFFGLDLRYLNLIIALILIVTKLFYSKVYITARDIFLFLFFLDCFFSVFIAYYNQNIFLIEDKLISQSILYLNNFCGFVVFLFYKKLITLKNITKYFIVSLSVLLISIFWIMLGNQLTTLFGSEVPGFYSGFSHVNLFGMNVRYAGYADDPNYANLFSIIGLILINNSKTLFKKTFLYFSSIICLIIYSLSLSKTLTIGIICTYAGYSLINKINFTFKLKYLIYVFLATVIMLSPLILLKLNFFSQLATISTRYNMWQVAIEMFLDNPIVGYGLTGFRCVYNELYRGLWYVQTHSTYMQIISEQGLIGFTLFFFFIMNILKVDDKLTIISIFIFLFFSINFESVYLQIFIVLTYLIGSRNKNIEFLNNYKENVN